MMRRVRSLAILTLWILGYLVSWWGLGVLAQWRGVGEFTRDCFRLSDWFVGGLVIGTIYFAIALYYFYDNFVIPSRQEARAARFSAPDLPTWAGHWFFPVLLLQLFIILGFWLTIARSPFEKSVYTHAVMYGAIYNRFHGDTVALKSQAQAAAADTYGDYLLKPALQPTNPCRKAHSENLRTETQLHRIPFFIAVAFGFLGALIYTLHDIARRFYASDLYPKTFVNYVIRFLFACSLCVTIANFLMEHWPIYAAPILFFWIGHFPERAMQFVEEKASALLSVRKKEERQEVPLSLLQGMSDYMIYRFKEVGIDDAQNLALADLGRLRDNLGYGDLLLCDFVAQAILLVYLKDYFPALQRASIRSILSFRRVVRRDNCAQLAELLKIPAAVLSAVLDSLDTEAMQQRLAALEGCAMDAPAHPTPQPSRPEPGA